MSDIYEYDSYQFHLAPVPVDPPRNIIEVNQVHALNRQIVQDRSTSFRCSLFWYLDISEDVKVTRGGAAASQDNNWGWRFRDICTICRNIYVFQGSLFRNLGANFILLG